MTCEVCLFLLCYVRVFLNYYFTTYLMRHTYTHLKCDIYVLKGLPVMWKSCGLNAGHVWVQSTVNYTPHKAIKQKLWCNSYVKIGIPRHRRLSYSTEEKSAMPSRRDGMSIGPQSLQNVGGGILLCYHSHDRYIQLSYYALFYTGRVSHIASPKRVLIDYDIIGCEYVSCKHVISLNGAVARPKIMVTGHFILYCYCHM